MVRRVLLLGMLMVLAGCARPAPEGIARVGDRMVRAEDFQSYLEEVTGQPWTAAEDRVAVRLLDQFLDQEVVLEAARRRGLAGTEGAGRDRERRVRELVLKLCGEAPSPPPEEVARRVAQLEATPVPPRVRARQMVFQDEASARRALARLRAGEAWEKVSREMSRAPNAAEGGSLGVLTRGQLPEATERVLFALEPGAVSGLVQGPGGFHIFQVLERTPAGPPDEARLSRRVQRELEEEAARRHVRGCLEALEREVGVRVNPARLWFRYDGRRTEDRHEAG